MTLSKSTLHNFRAPPEALSGKTILITGASDGIGKALAIACAKIGATVILLGRQQHKLEAVYDDIKRNGYPEAVIVPLDFMKADGGAYLSLAEQIGNDYGELHALVHCAGILGEMTEIEDYDATVWQQVMHVNATAAFALTKVCIGLIRRGKGAIVFTSSSVGRKGRAFWGAYAVSKFAVEGLAQTLADELKEAGVRVNVVNPGATRTAMRQQAYPGEDRDRLKTPEDVLPSFLYFLCDDTDGVTGESVDAQ